MYIYIHIFSQIRFSFQKQSSVGFLIGRKLGVCGLASLLKCDFNRVAIQLCWGHTSTWVFYEIAPYFQDTSLWDHLNLYFAKTLLSLTVHFKDTFTLCYDWFVHDSQIFNILQLLLII